MEDYNEIEIHRRMLKDSIRCRAFQEACRIAIRAGETVLDVGAGTGILSLFALQAGARRVYSVETARIAGLAQRVINDNNAADRIIVINADMECAELPEPVDVIVSEWLGSMGINENLLYPVLVARDRWLKPGGKMIPWKVDAWLAPVRYNKLEDERRFWNSKPYMINLGEMIKDIFYEPIYSCNELGVDDLAAPPLKLWSTDVYTLSASAARQPFCATCFFIPSEQTTISALTGWFEAELYDGVSLTNSPYSPPTHWGRILFPLNPSLTVEKNSTVSVTFTCLPVQSGCSDYEAKIAVDQVCYVHRWKTPRSSANIEGSMV